MPRLSASRRVCVTEFLGDPVADWFWLTDELAEAIRPLLDSADLNRARAMQAAIRLVREQEDKRDPELTIQRWQALYALIQDPDELRMEAHRVLKKD